VPLILAPFLLTKEMTLNGVSNQNIGTQFTTYSEVREKLPLEVMCVSQELEHVPSMASDREFATMECCFSNPVRGNCRLMELRQKNIICKYRLRHVILVSNFSLKNPLI
jgi:hypothetical protein